MSLNMPQGRIHVDAPLFADEAMAMAASLLSGLSARRPVLLYAAPLRLASVVLGAYQHAAHALRPEALDLLALPVLRRRTGGGALWGGQGVLYVALGLLDPSTLMKCPPGRILNRNVRGALAGLRRLGVPTHYFGRDFLSFGADPGVYVGWDEAADGRVLLEFFVAVETSFALPQELVGYPPSSEPAYRGKIPTTLHRAGKTQPSAAEVIAALATGYDQAFAVQFDAQPPSLDERERAQALRPLCRVELNADDGLYWSLPHEEAIGFVSAGARLDTDGRIDAVQIGGDFFQHQDCAGQLAARLVGTRGGPMNVAAALDAVYAARPGLIEGVRSLRTLAAALLDAIDRAQRKV
jgi:lipoate-protein ligase A